MTQDHDRGEVPFDFWCDYFWFAGTEIDGEPDDVAAYKRFLLAGPCTYCDRPAEHLDHAVPRAHGGEDHWSNLTPICCRCNSSKGTKSLLGFLGAMIARPALLAARETMSRWAVV